MRTTMSLQNIQDREDALDAEALEQERVENQQRAILATWFDEDKIEKIIEENRLNLAQATK